MEIKKEKTSAESLHLSWKIVLFAIVLILYFIHPSKPFNSAIETLTGQGPNTDIAQDVYGFKAMIYSRDTYPLLSVVCDVIININCNLTHASTHPPTAYLLTAPVAMFPWPIASALWGWLMLIIIIASLRLYGLPWWICLFSLFWPPVTFSLGQLTPIWIFGIAMAYKYQNKSIVSGIWIAIASLTKFFPALLLIPFIIRRKWSVLIGFLAVWVIILLLVFVINPDVIPRYIEVNILNSPENILRADNTAFLPSLFLFINWPGFVIGSIFLIFTAWIGRNNWHIWEYLAIALLPISWVYSLLPLLPGILKHIDKPIAGVIFLIPMLSPSYGTIASFAFLPVFILSGISLIKTDEAQ